MTARNHPRCRRFADFELDLAAVELRKSGVRTKLTGKPLEALALLLDRAGSIVTREELCERLWGPETFVDFQDSLNHVIQRLRDALGDDAKTPRFIETVPRFGYRFIGELDEETKPETPAESRITSGSTATANGPRRWLAALAVLFVFALIAAVAFAPGPAAEAIGPSSGAAHVAAPPPTPAVAVLPFLNLSGKPDQGVLTDALADALWGELARIGSLRVISRTSTRRIVDSDAPLSRVADELGVTHFVEGSALHAGSEVRISVQLIEARSEISIWADSFEEASQGLISRQGRIAREVARAIQVELTPAEEDRLAAVRPVRRDVYEAYMGGPRGARERGSGRSQATTRASHRA